MAELQPDTLYPAAAPDKKLPDVEAKDVASNAHDHDHSTCVICCIPRHQPTSPATQSRLVAQLAEAYDEASAACGVSKEAFESHVLELVNTPGSAEKDGLDSPDVVLEWRRCLRRIRGLKSRLGEQEQAHSRLMSIRPDGGGVSKRPKESELRSYQGLYQSMMRLRTSVESLTKSIAKTEERQQQLESATVALRGQARKPAYDEVCRIRVAHVFYIQRQVCLDRECAHPVHTRKGCSPLSWLRRRLRGEPRWGQIEEAGIQIVALSPRTSEAAERDSVRDSFSVHPVAQ